MRSTSALTCWLVMGSALTTATMKSAARTPGTSISGADGPDGEANGAAGPGDVRKPWAQAEGRQSRAASSGAMVLNEVMESIVIAEAAGSRHLFTQELVARNVLLQGLQ